MICTLIVFQQLRFMQNKTLGYKKDHMLIVPAGDNGEKNQLLKQELASNPSIKRMAFSSHVPSSRLMDFRDVQVSKPSSGEPVKYNIKVLAIDHDFIPAYQMRLIAGRNFSKEFPSDDSTAFILNEAAIKEIGWSSAQQAVDQPFINGKQKGRIIGVVENVHFESLHQKIEPLLFEINANRLGYLSVSIEGNTAAGAIAHIEQSVKKIDPDKSFTYQFLDQKFDELYKTELSRGKLFTIFTCVSIFIACLGLFALASFIITQRTREIGVRKVLGAPLESIFGLVIKEFILLVVIAFIIAAPVGYYAVSQWLDAYAYRISISPLIFLVAGVITLVIALLTVSYQAIKIAVSNPVKSLRTE
jgi:putative ABC transport system permease protein